VKGVAAVLCLLVAVASCGGGGGVRDAAPDADGPGAEADAVADAVVDAPADWTEPDVDAVPDGDAGADARADAAPDTSTASVCGTLIDLGTLPGDSRSTAVAINDLGQVVGTSSDAKGSRVFVWQSGTMTAVLTYLVPRPVLTEEEPVPVVSAVNHGGKIAGGLQYPNAPKLRVDPAVWLSPTGGTRRLDRSPNASSSGTTAINDAGQVIGPGQVCTDATLCLGLPKRMHAFFWQSDTATGVDVGTLGGTGGGASADPKLLVVETSLVALNQAGQAVGWSFTPAENRHAVLWSAAKLQDLGTLGGPSSQAYAIDEAGAVFGTSATASGQTDVFKWTNGSMTDLGALPAGGSTVAVNRVGDAIGRSSTGGYFWRAGSTTALPMTVVALNDRGEVAGVNGANHLLVWRDGVTSDLGSLGPTAVSPLAMAIDDQGRIVGTLTTETRALHGFLFQPTSCSN
jgi:probable HAF family extracellular repeat protein